MMQHIIGLVGSYFSSGLGQYFFFPLLILAFLAVVPCLFRYFFRR